MIASAARAGALPEQCAPAAEPSRPASLRTRSPAQVRSGLGSLPADFDEAAKRAGLPSSASNLARWQAYAVARMYDPAAAKL